MHKSPQITRIVRKIDSDKAVLLVQRGLDLPIYVPTPASLWAAEHKGTRGARDVIFSDAANNVVRIFTADQPIYRTVLNRLVGFVKDGAEFVVVPLIASVMIAYKDSWTNRINVWPHPSTRYAYVNTHLLLAVSEDAALMNGAAVFASWT